MSEPKIETVAADQTRTKAPLCQIGGSVSDDIASHGSSLDWSDREAAGQTRGSHEKKRTPMTRPMMPQAPTTTRSMAWIPEPWTARNEPTRASAKWRTGKIFESASIQT